MAQQAPPRLVGTCQSFNPATGWGKVVDKLSGNVFAAHIAECVAAPLAPMATVEFTPATDHSGQFVAKDIQVHADGQQQQQQAPFNMTAPPHYNQQGQFPDVSKLSWQQAQQAAWQHPQQQYPAWQQQQQHAMHMNVGAGHPGPQPWSSTTSTALVPHGAPSSTPPTHVSVTQQSGSMLDSHLASRIKELEEQNKLNPLQQQLKKQESDMQDMKEKQAAKDHANLQQQLMMQTIQSQMALQNNNIMQNQLSALQNQLLMQHSTMGHLTQTATTAHQNSQLAIQQANQADAKSQAANTKASAAKQQSMAAALQSQQAVNTADSAQTSAAAAAAQAASASAEAKASAAAAANSSAYYGHRYWWGHYCIHGYGWRHCN